MGIPPVNVVWSLTFYTIFPMLSSVFFKCCTSNDNLSTSLYTMEAFFGSFAFAGGGVHEILRFAQNDTVGGFRRLCGENNKGGASAPFFTSFYSRGANSDSGSILLSSFVTSRCTCGSSADSAAALTPAAPRVSPHDTRAPSFTAASPRPK